MINHLYDIFNHWNHCGAVWVYSDPHFGDVEAYKLRFPEKFKYNDTDPHAVRPSDEWITAQLDTMQIKNINSVCGKKDTLIILGDVGDIYCVQQLKAAHKVLILGNHDRGASNYKRITKITQVEINFADRDFYKLLADEGFKQFTDVNENLYFREEDNKLFDEVYEGPLMVNDRLILSHEPIDPLPKYMFNIHGHVHSKEASKSDHHMNVCAEAIDYKPVCLTKLLKTGLLKNINSIHRITIDIATDKKVRKEKKNCIL